MTVSILSEMNHGVYDDIINQIIDNYYAHVSNLIEPFIFLDQKLCRLISFHRLVKRNIKVEKQFTRKRVFDIEMLNTEDIYEIFQIMKKYKAFDLNMSCNCYLDPKVAAEISREKCSRLINLNGYQIYERFNCNECLDENCKNNVLLKHSYLYVDVDLKPIKTLADAYLKIREIEDDLKIRTIIKTSSHKGLHMLLPLSTVKTHQSIASPLERTLLQYSFGITIKKHIEERIGTVQIDTWNFIDLNQSVRAPFSLHYKYLTPSILLTDKNYEECIKKLEKIVEENEPLSKINLAKELVVSSKWDFDVKFDNTNFVVNCFEKLKHEALKKALRIKIIKKKQKTPAWFRKIIEKKQKPSKEDMQKMKKYFKSLGKSDEEAEHIIKKIIEAKQ